jgi:hypothetical protein
MFCAQVIYDCGPVDVAWESFDELRSRVHRTWTALPPAADPLSASLHAKIEQVTAEMRAAGAASQEV